MGHSPLLVDTINPAYKLNPISLVLVQNIRKIRMTGGHGTEICHILLHMVRMA